jgi:hypothetical protein
VVTSGWCLLAFDVVGQGQPLADWRGEMGVENKDEYTAATSAGADLYLECKPYGGVFEAWHGPVSVSAMSAEDDPDSRRLRLRAAGPLQRGGQAAASDEADTAEATA